jgi:hypothetical protein
MFILALFFEGWGSPTLQAQSKELENKGSENLDVVLLLDASGSMRITDPTRLREQGAKLFMQFLKTGDRIAIIQFAQEAKIISPLEDFSPFKMLDFERAVSTVGDSGVYTDLLTAVTQAATVLLEQGRPEAKKLIVLLSDGKMDPHPSIGTPGGATRRLLQDILPDLKVKGITIHTLAFSDQADSDILSQIALGTDGINWFTNSVEQVHKSFADLFLVVKKPQVVPLTKKGFTIDEAIDEATYYVDVSEKDEVIITSPLGKRFTESSKADGLSWYKGDHFAVITIEQPDVGVWIVEGLSKRDGFATVLTSIKLLAEWPNSTRVGEKALLRAQLYEANRPISLPDMSGVVKYAYQITPTDKISAPVKIDMLNDEGKNGDEVPNDGIFSAFIEMEEDGEYRLRIIARAPTFEREQNRPFRVRDPWIKIELDRTSEHISDVAGHSASESEDESDGHNEGHATTESLLGAGDMDRQVFRITLSQDVSSFKDIEVSLATLDEENHRYILPVTKSRREEYTYFTPTDYLTREGIYQVRGLVTLKPRKGQAKKELSKNFEYNNHSEEEHEEHEIQDVVIKKKEQRLEVKHEKHLPIFELILITILNCCMGVGALTALRYKAKKSKFAVPVFAPDINVSTLLEDLKTKIESKEIDFADSRFAGGKEQEDSDSANDENDQENDQEDAKEEPSQGQDESSESDEEEADSDKKEGQ